MTHKEAIAEVRQQHGPAFPFKLVGLVLAVVAMLALAATSAPMLVQKSVGAGATSRHVMLVSEWGSILLVAAIAGYFVVSKSIRIIRFCGEMCARGRAIEATLLHKEPL